MSAIPLLLAAAMVPGVAPPATSADDVVRVTITTDHGTDRHPDHARALLLGRLLYTRVSVRFDSTPVREAMAILRRTSGLPIVARYDDDPVGLGIDPAQTITLRVEDAPARDVLEELLTQCSVARECTWQLRRGFIEVGTKERLSVPAARETRLYPIRDLMLDAPSLHSKRAQPLGMAVEVVGTIVETIEPGRWDYGQPRKPLPAPERLEERPENTDSDEAGDDLAPDVTSPQIRPTTVDRGPASQRQADVAQWATIRIWRDHLVVIAPDFMHREIDGYPKPIPPEESGHVVPNTTKDR